MPIGYRAVPSGPLDRLFRSVSRALSHYSGGADKLATQEALQGFARAQKLANDTVEHVAKKLKVGMTEIEAAQLLADYLKAHGTERYLHRPFAWFGDHARFDYSNYDEYHPSDRKLEAGASAILDVAPFVDGYIGDVGYAVAIGAPNPELEKAKIFQLELRAQIPKLFASSLTPAAIWMEVDRLITAAGYDTIHAKYPFCALGHRVFRVKAKTGKHLRIGRGGMGWFSLETNLAFLRLGTSAALNAENVGKKTGLWAIEPHIGWPGGGCKFEEILVVEPGHAYWLTDDVPHVREAKRSKASR